MFLDAAFLGILALVKMWRMDRLLTGLSMIPMVLLLIIGTIVGRAMMRKWEIRQQAFSDLSDFAQESFSGFAVIKAFVKELKELAAFRKLNVLNENVNVEYIGYFSSIVWPIMAVSMLIEKTSRGKASLNRVRELLDAEINVNDAPGAVDIGSVKGKIEMRNLNFRYPDGEFDVLRNVSFTIEPGENVGIVGKTGAGKPTLVDLILRIYNVPDGTLFVDGHDVNSVTLHSLRENCSYVPQDNFLFSDTIANNISFAFDETDTAAVKRAAELADVDDNIVEFKDGYDTVLGERGVTVSGGQKQRISIARALLKNAPILILDDSVSAVDTSTEQVILKNLRETRAGKTTILIAHRISTIQDMDKIIFMDDGRIVAVGKHDELLERCEEYRKTVELQKLEDEFGGK